MSKHRKEGRVRGKGEEKEGTESGEKIAGKSSEMAQKEEEEGRRESEMGVNEREQQ